MCELLVVNHNNGIDTDDKMPWLRGMAVKCEDDGYAWRTKERDSNLFLIFRFPKIEKEFFNDWLAPKLNGSQIMVYKTAKLIDCTKYKDIKDTIIDDKIDQSTRINALTTITSDTDTSKTPSEILGGG